MIPAELLLYGIFAGLGVGIFIGVRYCRPTAEQTIIVIAPSIADGRSMAEQMRAGYQVARDLAKRN